MYNSLAAIARPYRAAVLGVDASEIVPIDSLTAQKRMVEAGFGLQRRACSVDDAHPVAVAPTRPGREEMRVPADPMGRAGSARAIFGALSIQVHGEASWFAWRCPYC